jgi:hypothetical protein
MWCPQCQADVATEVAADGQALLCTACGAEVRKVFAPSLHPETRSARDLLQRWAAEELLNEPEAIQPPEVPEQPPARPSKEQRPPRAAHESRRDEGRGKPKKPKAKFRIDAPHPTQDVVGHSDAPVRPQAQPVPLASAAQRREALPPGYYQHSPHAQIPAPHIDLQALIEHPEKSGRSESLWGQMLAYAGVGILTVGTVLVLWGHFGNVAQYASTGWLVATGGQMLLMLGVVTLVSGGMQQTTHEVSRRVERIGDRMIRIEQSTRDILNGPHFAQTGAQARARTAATVDDEAEN